MRNNYMAFLFLGTLIMGTADVKASEGGEFTHTVSFEKNLNKLGSEDNLDSLSQEEVDQVAKIFEIPGHTSAVPPTTKLVTIDDLVQPAPCTLRSSTRSKGLVKVEEESLNNLTNKGNTYLSTSNDISVTVNTFLSTFKDAFEETKKEAGNQLKETGEEAVKFLLDSLKGQALVWGETAKDIMNDLVGLAEQKYPTVTALLVEQLKKIKFTTIEGKLVALVREKADDAGCCGCLAKSALSVYEYYKNQGQNAPIVVPKETEKELKKAGMMS